MTEIRAARPADAAGIAAVHVASWQAAYRNLLPAEMLAGLSVAARERMWASILRDPPPSTAVLVAVADETIAGFVSIGPNRDGEPSTGELCALYLHPDRWRCGLGTRLHAAACTRLAALGFTDATLWVLDGNERAIAFYRRSGWVDDGHRCTDTGPGGVALPEHRWRRLL